MALQPPKSCFGKSWNGEDVRCRGGLDPVYVHPETGSNQREPCAWFAACAARTNAARMAQQPQAGTQIQASRPPQQNPAQIATPTSPWSPIKNVASTMSRLTQIPPMPQVPQQVQVMPPQQPQQPMQQMVPAMPPQQMMQHMAGPQMVQPMMAMSPYMVPMNFQWPGSQMPGYLTIPEPIVEGQHWMTRLFYNVARSMAKASGHTVANFFDHTPINPWQTPASKE